jgi:hypothetical protein
MGEERPSGAKAPNLLNSFSARLKPCPFKTVIFLSASVLSQLLKDYDNGRLQGRQAVEVAL